MKEYLKYKILNNNAVSIIGHTEDLPANVQIPDKIIIDGNTYNVIEIGYAAFADCKKLVRVNIPNSVATMRTGAFGECDNLTQINLPYSITEIGRYTFMCCYELKELEIPESVTNVEKYAFKLCKNLVVTIAKNSPLQDSDFAGCKEVVKK